MERIELGLSCSAIQGVTALRLALTEAISRPTHASLLLSTEDELDLEGALGKEAVVTVSVDGEEVRRWTLVVTEFRYESSTEHAHRYTLELDHELALLGLRSDVRMFQKKTTKDIVAFVLQQAGVAAEHVKWDIDRALSPREYCVQHRETDFDFISRLLEYEGIFYVSTEADSRAVVFSDKQSAFASFDGSDGDVDVVDGHGHGARELALEYAMTTDALSLRDFTASRHPAST